MMFNCGLFNTTVNIYVQHWACSRNFPVNWEPRDRYVLRKWLPVDGRPCIDRKHNTTTCVHVRDTVIRCAIRSSTWTGKETYLSTRIYIYTYIHVCPVRTSVVAGKHRFPVHLAARTRETTACLVVHRRHPWHAPTLTMDTAICTLSHRKIKVDGQALPVRPFFTSRPVFVDIDRYFLPPALLLYFSHAIRPYDRRISAYETKDRM